MNEHPSEDLPKLTNGRSRIWVVWIGLCMSLLPALTLIMFLQPVSNTAYLLWQFNFTMSVFSLALCLLVGFAVGITYIYLGKTKSETIRLLGRLAATFVALLVGILISNAIERFATQSIPLRAQPLITAISAYEIKYKEPPASLQQLVPEFIAAIPRTGIPGFPSFDYRLLHLQERSRWELCVQLPSVDFFEQEWRVFRPGKASSVKPNAMQLSDWIYTTK